MPEVYATQIPGRPFASEKQWKGQRPVSEADVDFMAKILEDPGASESERAKAACWLADYRTAAGL